VIIKLDAKGIYGQEDGWICRPQHKSYFKVGNKVNAHHPAGPVVNIRSLDKKIREIWATDCPYWEYKKEKSYGMLTLRK